MTRDHIVNHYIDCYAQRALVWFMRDHAKCDKRTLMGRVLSELSAESAANVAVLLVRAFPNDFPL